MIHLVVEEAEVVLLVAVYAKSRQGNLTVEEQQILAGLAGEFRREVVAAKRRRFR